MLGDPKVIAALAIAIVATPPVVNGILAKALDQADTDWLKDFDVNPPPPDHIPDNIHPQPGDRQFQGNMSGRGGPQPKCTPQLQSQATRQVDGPVNPDTSSDGIEYVTRPGDLGVVYGIQGRSVTGYPAFQVLEGQVTKWDHPGTELHTNADIEYGNPRSPFPASPGVRWTLSWDFGGGVAHQGFGFALFTVRCAEAGP